MSTTPAETAPPAEETRTPDTDPENPQGDSPTPPEDGETTPGQTEGQEDGDTGSESQDDVTKLKAVVHKERQARKAAERRARELESERNKLPEDASVEERIEAAKREARTEAQKEANLQVVTARLQSAAKGVLTNPEDALVFLNPEDYVGDSGAVDMAELDDAVASLIADRPYLAAQQEAPKRRFQTRGDGGSAAPPRSSQVTRAELESMTPEQIAKADREGRLQDLRTGKA